jgi:predicted Kef-type K+ transport protein
VDYLSLAIVLALALTSGLAFKRVGLPPMIGFLISGFILGELALELPWLEPLADIGIILLLFTIGLKLELRALAMPQVWAVTGLHMLVSVGAMMLILKGIAMTIGSHYLGQDWASLATIAFALSFSSTVFVVKVLEDRGESNSLHGKIAIGILVMQDLIAVAYLTINSGVLPNIWAFTIPLIVIARPLILKIMDYCGHDELLVLLGFAYAFGAAALFKFAGLKADLGALFIGIVLAGDFKTRELAKTLPKFKELFLIGFFMTIGSAGLPDADAWVLAVIITGFVFIKPLGYMLLLTRMRLRARSSLLSSLVLTNYSEFGLIVAVLGASSGIIDSQWPAIIALTIVLSFTIAAQLNKVAHKLYDRHGVRLRKLETDQRIDEQKPVDTDSAKILVIGMGRVGTGAYDYLREHYGDVVLGLDESAKRARVHTNAGRQVYQGDGTDRDFLVRLDRQKVKLIMLAMTNHAENIRAAETIRMLGYHGIIAATAHFTDEQNELTTMGITAFNLYAEAGTGFAEHVHAELGDLPFKPAPSY